MLQHFNPLTECGRMRQSTIVPSKLMQFEWLDCVKVRPTVRYIITA